MIAVLKAFAFSQLSHEFILVPHICAFVDLAAIELQKRSAVCFCDITAVMCENEVSHLFHTVELFALVIESGMTEELFINMTIPFRCASRHKRDMKSECGHAAFKKLC